MIVAQATVNVSGFTFTALFDGIDAQQASTVEVNNCSFKTCVSCMSSAGGSRLGIIGSVTVTNVGSLFSSFINAGGGTIVISENDGFTTVPLSVTFVGDPTFTLGTALANNGGSIVTGGSATFSGAAAGTRFVIQFGQITVGGNVNFFPGTVAGTTTVGIYA